MDEEKKVMTAEEKLAKIKEYQRNYMKNYHAKKRQDKGFVEKEKRQRRSSGLAKKMNLTAERERYGDYLEHIIKCSALMKEIKDAHPEFLPDILERAGVQRL
jgi:hypothetical protein